MRPWEKSASRDQWRSASRASADPRQQAGALESARVHGHTVEASQIGVSEILHLLQTSHSVSYMLYSG